MRILLASTASHVPPRGGATRSNLVWLRHLAAHGHECSVVCGAVEGGTPSDEESEWDSRVRIHAVPNHAQRAVVLREEIQSFQPDWVLVSSEDVGQALLREAHRAAPGRVVYLAHTPQFYPFGPESWNPDAGATELVKRSAAIVAIAQTTASYIRQHIGRDAVVIHPPIYGEGPFAELAGFDNEFITLINPCAVKGVSIFEALAARFPELKFAVVPGWGTTSAD